MTKKKSSEFFGVKKENCSEKNLILKSWSAETNFPPPPNSAPGLRHCSEVSRQIDDSGRWGDSEEFGTGIGTARTETVVYVELGENCWKSTVLSFKTCAEVAVANIHFMLAHLIHTRMDAFRRHIYIHIYIHKYIHNKYIHNKYIHT